MNTHLFGYAAVIVGLAIGAGAMIVARRTAGTREQAVSRQKTIQYIGLIVVAAVLVFDAFDTPRHRWLDAVMLILMVCGAAFNRVRGRRTKAS